MQGYEDTGEYSSSNKIAHYAVVFMVNGVACNLKQIFGYFNFHKRKRK